MKLDALLVSTGLFYLGWQSSAVASIAPPPQSPVVPSEMSTPLVSPGIAAPEVAPPESLLAQTERPDIVPLPETLPPNLPPLLETPANPSEETPAPGLNDTVQVKEIRVLGNTVFSPQEINQVTAPYVGKELTFEQLLEIRTAITNLYIERGFTTSGAFLPPQDVSDGIVEIQAVEGELEKIEIAGLARLRSAYVRDRIALAAQPPINIRRLETALQLLQLDPLFSRVEAELKAGTSPGRSVLSLNLREAPPFSLAFQVENRDSPSVGSVRGSVLASYDNLTGLGDRLSGEVGFTDGVESYDFSYAVPLNAREGTLTARYAESRSEIIEEPFSVLDILGKTRTFSVGFRQPLERTPTNEFALGLSLDLRRSETFLFEDIPFPFSPGSEDGETKVTVLRFSQDWINRTPQRVLAARSQFSIGLDAFGATNNSGGEPDGEFVSWVGQFQWVQSLGNGIISIARVAAQLTGDSLLPLEQFSVGGIDTVRGYRQNQRVADNGIVGSLEVRFPLVRDRRWGVVQIAPFFDIGEAWNNKGGLPSPRTLISTGVGLRWQIDPGFSARLDWGIRLNDIEDQGDSAQDEGFVFSIRVQPF